MSDWLVLAVRRDGSVHPDYRPRRIRIPNQGSSLAEEAIAARNVAFPQPPSTHTVAAVVAFPIAGRHHTWELNVPSPEWGRERIGNNLDGWD